VGIQNAASSIAGLQEGHSGDTERCKYHSRSSGGTQWGYRTLQVA